GHRRDHSEARLPRPPPHRAEPGAGRQHAGAVCGRHQARAADRRESREGRGLRAAIRKHPEERLMNSAVAKWLFWRAVRWLAWIAFFLYSAHFIAYRQEHTNTFGQLILTTELAMFGFAIAAVFAGF